jgi:hypothetical protein
MEVIVKINTLEGSGPYKITWTGYMEGETHRSIGGFENEPLVPSVPKWQLLNGFTFSARYLDGTPINGITQIRVKELGPCENYVDIDILSEKDTPNVPPGNIGDPGTPITELTRTENIKIIGSAIPGYPSTVYTMVRYDVWKYTVTGAFVNGNAQFDVLDSGIYGETSFPTGTVSGSDNIPVVAGNYKVTFDISTGEYSFI